MTNQWHEEIYELSDIYEEALNKLKKEQNALQIDKLERKESMLGRAIDFLTETPAEKRVSAAEAYYAEVKERVTKEVQIKMMDLAREAMKLDKTYFVNFRQAKFELEMLFEHEIKPLERVISLAQATIEKAEAAIESCQSASSLETTDFLMQNTGVSVISSLSTQSAKAAIGNFRDHLDKLFAAISEAGDALDLDVQRENFDRLNEIINFPIPFMSIFNKEKITDAISECEKINGFLQNFLLKQKNLLDTKMPEMTRLKNTISEMEKPYLQMAAENIPELLKFAIPDSWNKEPETALKF